MTMTMNALSLILLICSCALVNTITLNENNSLERRRRRGASNRPELVWSKARLTKFSQTTLWSPKNVKFYCARMMKTRIGSKSAARKACNTRFAHLSYRICSRTTQSAYSCSFWCRKACQKAERKNIQAGRCKGMSWGDCLKRHAKDLNVMRERCEKNRKNQSKVHRHGKAKCGKWKDVTKAL